MYVLKLEKWPAVTKLQGYLYGNWLEKGRSNCITTARRITLTSLRHGKIWAVDL